MNEIAEIIKNALLLIFLIFLTAEDIKKRSFPLGTIICALFVSAGYAAFFHRDDLLLYFSGFLIGAVLYIVSLLSKEKIGRGDAVVFMISGFLTGFYENMMLLFLSTLFSGMFSIFLLLFKKGDMKTRIAFSPFILLSFIILAVWRICYVYG